MNKNKFAYLKKEAALPCPPGSPLKDEHELVWEGNNMTLKKVGVINTQKQIESYRDSVDLGRMIERFKRGDDSALERGKGFYEDVSNISPDLAEQINNQRMAAEYLSKSANKRKQEEKAAEPQKTPVEPQKTPEEVSNE